MWERDPEGGAGISIHAPREGSDLILDRFYIHPEISIHAPREGSDSCHPHYPPIFSYFNPRSP